MPFVLQQRQKHVLHYIFSITVLTLQKAGGSGIKHAACVCKVQNKNQRMNRHTRLRSLFVILGT